MKNNNASNNKTMKQRNCTLSAVALLAAALTATHSHGQATYTPYTFTTLAGNNGNGSADGTNSAARFAQPKGAAVDPNGNVYVADTVNHTIREMRPVGTNWVVTTLAGLAGSLGSADGTGSAARFNNPGGVAVDSSGNLYVADAGNSTIREITPVGTNWVVTTLAGLAGSPGSADGTNSAAQFNQPYGLEVDSAGNVYVADTYNDTIRKVTLVGTNWVVTTLAGLGSVTGSADGTGSAARFNHPFGVAVDSAGNLYVADSWNSTIRKVTLVGTNWVVTTLAGLAGSFGSNDGTGSAARFDYPIEVAVDSATNLYVGDWGNSTIRKVTPVGASWEVTTLAGSAGTYGSADGTNSAAQFNHPWGVAVDSATNLYVGDWGNDTIRKVTPVGANWVVTTLAGRATGSVGSADGTGSAARFDYPAGVAVDSAGNVYVADDYNSTIRKVTSAGVVTTLATGFHYPWGVAVDTNGNVYVGDQLNDAIRKVTPAGEVTTLATGFNDPSGVAVDSAGNVYVADSYNDTVRKVTPAGVVTTLAGLAGNAGSADGTGSAARFDNPTGVAVDSAGNVYVADEGNSTIRKVTPVGASWEVTTLVGSASTYGDADGTNSAARFKDPYFVAVDTNGNVYATDSANDTIRKITPVGTNWVVTTLAGLAGTYGSADGTGSAAQFDEPFGVAVDSAGNLYVADASNNTIRKGFPASSVPAPVLRPPSLSAGQFGFGITGLPGLAVNIESSGDLSQWQVIGTVILEGGTNSFVSPNPSLGAQFYRGHVR
jgi:hypothetical protein